LQGFVHALLKTAAQKEGREAELVTSAKNQADLEIFHRHVEAYLREQGKL